MLKIYSTLVSLKKPILMTERTPSSAKIVVLITILTLKSTMSFLNQVKMSFRVSKEPFIKARNRIEQARISKSFG